MGLRAAERRAARNRGRPGADDRHQPARGAGLSVAAARGPGGAACPASPTIADAPRRGLAARRRTRRRSTRRRGFSRRRENPLIVTADAGRDRPRCRRSPNSPSVSRSRSSSTPAPPVACRPTIPAISATTRRPVSTMPTRSSSSIATCRGSRAVRRAAPDCKVIHIGVDPLFQPLSDPRLSLRCRDHRRAAAALPELGAALAPHRRQAAVAARRAARRRAPRGDAGAAGARRATRRRDDAPDRHGLGQRLPRRGARSRGCDHRQRIHPDARALPARPGRAAISGRARRRGSAGAPVRRSASSSPSPTGRSSRSSATAPTCSPTRSRCTTPPRCTGCRCCSSSSTTRCGARCAAPPSACTRRARPRAATGRRLIDLDELPAFEQVCAAAGGYGERVEDPADSARRPRARPARRQRRKAPGPAQRHLPQV